MDVGDYIIVRSESAGVFAGTLKFRAADEVVLLNARRLWYWSGAASLSQLSVEGVKRPAQCKFPCEVPEVIVFRVIELLPVSVIARESIAGVPVWQE